MRINKFVASASDLSRRAVDTAIADGRIQVNGTVATIGQEVTETDTVTLDGRPLQATQTTTTIILNKPVGYVCSRDGQGNPTIYDILPPEFQSLNPVGRLDKNSSGLLLMTNDGDLAHQLTHPSFQKEKVYEVRLDKKLGPVDLELITTKGVTLEDGISKFAVEKLTEAGSSPYKITMHEGRNRQIRRTFEALGYKVRKLHRTQFGPYKLANTKQLITIVAA